MIKIVQLLLILSAAGALCSCGRDAEPEEWVIDAQWRRTDPMVRMSMVKERVSKLARAQLDETVPHHYSDVQLALLEKRQLYAIRFLTPWIDEQDNTFPVLSEEKPQPLSAEEQTHLTQLLTTWNGDDLYQYPEELTEYEALLLQSLGFAVDLEGIAQSLQTKAETRNRDEKIILQQWQACRVAMAIPGSTTARLYWWDKDGTRCLLYFSQHQAILFTAPIPGKIILYSFWDYPYYRSLQNDESVE